MLTDLTKVDVTKARIYLRTSDGVVLVKHYDKQALAYAVYLGAPMGGRLAFRGAGDTRPVYAWDFVRRGVIHPTKT